MYTYIIRTYSLGHGDVISICYKTMYTYKQYTILQPPHALRRSAWQCLLQYPTTCMCGLRMKSGWDSRLWTCSRRDSPHGPPTPCVCAGSRKPLVSGRWSRCCPARRKPPDFSCSVRRHKSAPRMIAEGWCGALYCSKRPIRSTSHLIHRSISLNKIDYFYNHYCINNRNTTWPQQNHN